MTEPAVPTAKTTRAAADDRCRWPGRWSRTWPSSTAPASARSSCAAPAWTPASIDTVLVPCGHTLAHVCPSCAERARTLRAAQCREGWHLEDEPDHRTRPGHRGPEVLGRNARRRPAAPRPGRQRRAGHQPTWTSSSASWTRRSPTRACAGRPPRTGRRGGTGPPAVAKTHPTYPADGQPPHPGQDLHHAGRQDLPPVPVRHPDLPSYGRVGEDGTPADPAPTTTTGRPGTRWPSPRCSTGSSRTCAATSVTTCSTSPPSNPSGASPRTCTSPCAAPSPAPRSAASWPPPTTRSGGLP